MEAAAPATVDRAAPCSGIKGSPPPPLLGPPPPLLGPGAAMECTKRGKKGKKAAAETQKEYANPPSFHGFWVRDRVPRVRFSIFFIA
jgi:hypothetical protein